MNTLELSKYEPIEVVDNKELVIRYIPERQVLGNIPVIWTMLEQVIQDWSTASQAYPSFESVRNKDEPFFLE